MCVQHGIMGPFSLTAQCVNSVPILELQNFHCCPSGFLGHPFDLRVPLDFAPLLGFGT